MPDRLNIDMDAFVSDIDGLRNELKADVSEKDLSQFKGIELAAWGFVGVAMLSAGWGVNPVAIFAFAAASFARWTILAHHISHRGYENVPGTSARYQSKTFARGWRRIVDWMDWIYPEAWHHEHDVLHHYNLGEETDPDVPQDNAELTRMPAIPLPFRYLLVAVIAMIWKPFYYGPSTLNQLLNKKEKTNHAFDSMALWSPFQKRFWQVLWHCWLPYVSFRFVFLPSLFLVISPEAAISALINLLIAEIIINVWTYIIIVPNHGGSDIFVFDKHPKNRGEFYIHQIVGSVDYDCGGIVKDCAQGFLNYQIEHHLFPDLTVLQYQKAHTKLREICKVHGIPVVSESIFKRMPKLIRILVGLETQPLWPGTVGVEAAMQKAA